MVFFRGIFLGGSASAQANAGASIEKAVFANLDINFTVRVEQDLDAAIAKLRYVGNSVIAIASTPPASPAKSDRYYVLGALAPPWVGYDDNYAVWDGVSAWVFTPAVPGEIFYVEDEHDSYEVELVGGVTSRGIDEIPAAYMNIAVEGQNEPRKVYLQPYIVGTAFREVDADVLIQDTLTRAANLSVTTQGTEVLKSYLSMLIKTPPPYQYMRMHGDLVTRYFGGNDSDPNFDANLGNIQGFDPPNPGRIETNSLGSFYHSFRKLVYNFPNTIPDAANYDKYSLPISSAKTFTWVGDRCLVSFTPRTFGPNSSVMFGMFNDQLDPFSSITSGDICAFAMEAEKDHVEFRAWYGTSDTPRNITTGLPISRFIDNPLVVEIEVVKQGVVRTAEFRLYEREVDLDNPLVKFSLDTTFSPTVNTFSITSLGRRAASLPASTENAVVDFEHVDIERGAGFLYDPSGAGEIPVSGAKWRPYIDRPPFKLGKEGVNAVTVVLSNDGVNATYPATDTITVDTSDPIITVVALEPDSPVTDEFALNPPIIKGSLNPGFSGVSMRWYCTHHGTWTLRVNSTGVVDGIEIASGDYPTAGEVAETTWDFADLPQVDAVYDVTLYVIAESGKPTAKRLGIYIAPLLSSDLNLGVAETLQVSSDLDMRIIS